MTPGVLTRSASQPRSSCGIQEPRANCGPTDTPRPVTFSVPGIPAPKGSRIVGHRKDGSSFTRPASKRETAWTDAVALIAGAHRPAGCTLGPPYRVSLAFALPHPARPSHGHPSRGDLDKLVRAVLDGLTRGRLIVDDRHVTQLVATKDWAGPGAEGVTVTVETARGRRAAE